MQRGMVFRRCLIHDTSVRRSLRVQLPFARCLRELFIQGYDGFHHSGVRARLAVFLEGTNQNQFNQALWGVPG